MPIPALGQHTDAMLRELGFDDADGRALAPRRRGVTAGAPQMSTTIPPASNSHASPRRLRFDAIPAPVIARTEDLLLDWFGSALAGKGARPVEIDRALHASAWARPTARARS